MTSEETLQLATDMAQHNIELNRRLGTTRPTSVEEILKDLTKREDK